ncbi:alpha-2-macroglobulin family protein [soil metagenome]
MKTFDYEKAWKSVAENESKGLPVSALAAVDDIYKSAKSENNTGELAKALIHKFKFTDAKEEDSFIKNLISLREETEKSTFPLKPLLHSMLGELYWQYYQNNRYEFVNRSETVNTDEKDIQTWSLPKIIQETFTQYKLSLEDAEKSKIEKIGIYQPVLYGGNELGRAYRPTLYDFLSHRALNFFSSQESDITKPTYFFTLDREEYFLQAKDFIRIRIESKDTLSMKFYAINILQDLIRFHLDDKDPSSLVETDLRRLKFVLAHSVVPTKDALYFKALEQLEQNVASHKIVGTVTVEKAYVFVQTAALYKPLVSDDHKWDIKKAYELCEEAKKRFPDSDGAIRCENLQISIRAKTLSATIEEHNIPNKPFRSLVHYKNFTDLHYRIIKVTREEIRKQREKLANDYSGDREEKFIKYFAAKPVLKSGSYALADDGDYQQHTVEIKLDAIAEGEYMVLYSHHADFATEGNGLAYSFTVISNISYLHRTAADGGTEFFVLNRESGEPISGVNATVYTQRYNSSKSIYENVKSGSYISDASGYFKVPYFTRENRQNFSVNFSKGNDFNSTESIDREYYYYSSSINQYKYEAPDERMQTFFFLDRAIYRPGQTIYFKGLVIDTDGKNPKIMPDYATTVILYDVNHQEKGILKVKTNEYGTFNGVFTAPSGGLTGQMQIQNNDGSGSVAFSVEEYKRPKFEVGFNPVTAAFRLNDQIKVEGFARAYSGANIDGASVKYRVVRNANFPYWYWCRWGNYPSSPEMEILNGSAVSDAEGKFNIEFTAIPDLAIDRASDPTFTYTVYADVTDINGETHSSSTSVSVGYKSLLVSVSIGNINKDEKDLKDKFSINTVNLAGEFQAAKGDIKIYTLKAPNRAFRKRLWEQPDRQILKKEEYYSLFPHDLFADEDNKFKWAKDKEVLSAGFDTGKSKLLNIAGLGKWNVGEYVLEINSTDKDGQSVKEVTYFTVYAPSSKVIPAPSINYEQSVKTSAEPGEKAVFTFGTSEPAIKALYEVERDGVIITKEWITLKKEQRLFEILIKEEDRGNLAVHFSFIKDNRLYIQNLTISVPYTNKTLDVSFESFRDKLQPGANEEWKIVIKGKTADKVAAEMVATLYDASLDEFRANSWYAGFYNSMYARMGWQSTNGFGSNELTPYSSNWNNEPGRSGDYIGFDELNWFGVNFYQFSRESRRYRSGMAMGAAAPMKSKKSDGDFEMAEEVSMDKAEDSLKEQAADVSSTKTGREEVAKHDMSDVKIRKNFNETAFFYPTLQTNGKGEIIVKFTIPEPLTRWKMLGFAHTKDLKSGFAYNQLVTQKDIMVVPNQPRFFRENDKMKFSAKISSLVDKELAGQAQLEFFDALTMKSVDDLMKNQVKTQNFSLKPKQSTSLEWSIEIPEGIQAITYRIVAKAGDFSDGEEMVLPVVTNRMLVTETLPLPIRGKQTKEFRFEKLLNNKSTTLRHQRYTLEFTSNPAWYAIQALPYLMEYPYDCVEQTFSKFYANSIASHIANSNPRIKQVFDTWKNIQPDALLSNLEKNQELKSALLEETPWVLEAKDESQRKRMVGVLFDLNRMAGELDRAIDKVKKAQNSSGGFSWFPGFPEDRYMTQHIIAGLGHLDVMGVKSVRSDGRTKSMIDGAIGYMDRTIQDDYNRLVALAKRKMIKLEDNNISYYQFHYLYTRSYFKDIEIPASSKEAFNYFLGQAKIYWQANNNLYAQGMICLALNRFGDQTVTAAMIKSFSERSLHSEEMGMYWKNDHGYYWWQAPIETQALMIEVYDEVAGDTKSVDDLKVWLLKQKQTQDWKTTKATVEACYALLRRGSDVLSSTKQVAIKIGNQIIDPTKREDVKVEAGTGYFKTAWQAGDIKSEMGKITVTKTDEGVAWGAVYWQYFEQLDKITPAETPLKLKKDLFLVQNTDRGPVITPVNDKSSFHIGDLLKVRIELRVDRDMEYVHLKDMRAAGFEPVSTLSTFRYQDGLYYYESPRDLATNFFMGSLPKGTYVFEYNLRVSQKGNFSNGITTIQCMYAPEFASHSAGIRVDVK